MYTIALLMNWTSKISSTVRFTRVLPFGTPKFRSFFVESSEIFLFCYAIFSFPSYFQLLVQTRTMSEDHLQVRSDAFELCRKILVAENILTSSLSESPGRAAELLGKRFAIAVISAWKIFSSGKRGIVFTKRGRKSPRW